jgi:hypothetical protein
MNSSIFYLFDWPLVLLLFRSVPNNNFLGSRRRRFCRRILRDHPRRRSHRRRRGNHSWATQIIFGYAMNGLGIARRWLAQYQRQAPDIGRQQNFLRFFGADLESDRLGGAGAAHQNHRARSAGRAIVDARSRQARRHRPRRRCPGRRRFHPAWRDRRLLRALPCDLVNRKNLG